MLSPALLEVSSHPRHAQSHMKSPRLPPEIWIRIFSLASLVPGALDTWDYAAIQAFSKDLHGISQHNHYRATLDLKRSISLVCKAWNNLISATHLYEYIVITSGAHALQVASMLKDDCELSRVSQDWPSRVTRLELALEGVHIWTKGHTAALSRIIKFCSNLTCFSTIFSTADGYNFYSADLLDVLATTTTRKTTIKRLELKADTSVLMAIINCLATSLQALWIQAPRQLLRVNASLSWFPYLPELHTLISSLPCGGLLKDAGMPELRYLSTNDAQERAGILRRHGDSVLQLFIPCLVNLNEASVLCPNLKALDTMYNVPLAYDSFRLEHPFPAVSQITLDTPCFLRRALWDCGDSICRLYLGSLRSVLEVIINPNIFPSLQSLRIIIPLRRCLPGTDDSLPFLEDFLGFWHVWIDICLHHGIQLEVAEGSGALEREWLPLTSALLDFLSST